MTDRVYKAKNEAIDKEVVEHSLALMQLLLRDTDGPAEFVKSTVELAEDFIRCAMNAYMDYYKTKKSPESCK